MPTEKPTPDMLDELADALSSGRIEWKASLPDGALVRRFVDSRTLAAASPPAPTGSLRAVAEHEATSEMLFDLVVGWDRWTNGPGDEDAAEIDFVAMIEVARRMLDWQTSGRTGPMPRPLDAELLDACNEPQQEDSPDGR